jgi:3-isopropylmalate dehydrogenase
MSGERRKIAVIPGDGIGPEVIREAVEVIRALELPLELVHFDYGAERYLATGVAIEEPRFAELARDYAAILFGAVGDPRVPDQAHARALLLGLRSRLDLYINLRPARLLDERLCPLKDKRTVDVDFVVFRENTEGIYADLGGVWQRGGDEEIALESSLSTRRGVERILRAAFEFARRPGRRRRVCMVDKSNALPSEGGLWQRTFRRVAAEHSDVLASHLYVDAAAMEIVRAPERFDVIVTGNLFGDILTDLGAAVAGGLGLAASGNLHPGRCSLFEPVHGSAPDLAGRGVANPMGAILSVAMMLEFLGFAREAARVDAAVRRALAEDATTRDLGGGLGTVEVGDFVRRHL